MNVLPLITEYVQLPLLLLLAVVLPVVFASLLRRVPAGLLNPVSGS